MLCGTKSSYRGKKGCGVYKNTPYEYVKEKQTPTISYIGLFSYYQGRNPLKFFLNLDKSLCMR